MMGKAVTFSIGLACVANLVSIFLTLAPSDAKGDEVLSPAAQRGLIIVRANEAKLRPSRSLQRTNQRNFESPPITRPVFALTR